MSTILLPFPLTKLKSIIIAMQYETKNSFELICPSIMQQRGANHRMVAWHSTYYVISPCEFQTYLVQGGVKIGFGLYLKYLSLQTFYTTFYQRACCILHCNDKLKQQDCTRSPSHLFWLPVQ